MLDADQRAGNAAGNQLAIGATELTYDAENRQTSSSNPPAYGYVYDIFGKLMTEYTNFPNPTPACSTCHLTRDHLGSTRITSNSTSWTC